MIETMRPLRSALTVVVARPEAMADPRQRAAAEAVLDDADRAHVARFRFEADRDLALASRALQRRALSASAPAIAPSAWRFAADANGRPVITAPEGAPPLVFSAANTRGLVGCAVAEAGELGLDLETYRDDAPADLIDRYFAPAERAALAALPEPARPQRFVELWVLKEAYLKARGIGLGGIPLEQVAIRLDDGAPRLVLAPALADDAASWQLALWSPTPAHTAAVCVRRDPAGPDVTLHHRWA